VYRRSLWLGSGKSVVISEIIRTATLKKNHVLFLIHRREIRNQIEETLLNNDVDMNYVELGMVQTVVRRLDKTREPKIIVVDESHHAPASSYRKIFDHFSDAPRISFTATPIRLNGSGLGDVNDILIEEVSTKWLIENNYLSPYKYYAPKLIDTEKLKLNSLREFSSTSVDAAINEKKIYGDVIKHYRKLADGEQAIAYCHSVEASKETAEAFNQHGIKARHLDGKTPQVERDEIIKKFRDRKLKVITNVDIISEGFDIPDCSTVIMLRPTQSLSLFIQQSMRGMRYRPGKTSIIIDHVGNVNEHGLPDDDREWSLEGKKKSSGGKAENPVKQCENCFMTVPSQTRICPECEHEFAIEETEYDHDESAELEEVTESPIVMDFREPEDCKSMKELAELGKNRGYKPGWSYFQGKRLGFIN
jgi:superfamily II DNA or RNA helicase